MFEQELFEEDWAEAKARLGREPMIFELRAPPPAAGRRHGGDGHPGPHRTRGRAPPGAAVHDRRGYETFAGPPASCGTARSSRPGTPALWLGEAEIERVVFDGPSRVIDVGARRRFFRGALRRAIEVRDRTCFHPTCDEPPEREQVDHITEASQGGETTQDNGRLGCGFHNRRRTPIRTIGLRPAQAESPCDPDPPDG